MPYRDFFSYCTTLRPLELKAIGQLSYIQHLAAGRTVYGYGDPSATLYVVTRGTIELLDAESMITAQPLLLMRGDFFGDLETFTGTPRKHTARTRDGASVQCFHRDDFNELMRRAPSFFHFLTEHLAIRLERALAAVSGKKNEKLELSGNLANFDLVTIYQTIVSSRQTGELRIFGEQADLTAVFFFIDGQPHTGQFQHLSGEDAFTQLFLTESLTGTFLFSSEDRISSCLQSDVITRDAGDLLIRAIQARDELQQLKQRFPDRTATLHRRKLNFTTPPDTLNETSTVAAEIWQMAFSTPLAIAQLYTRCAVSELKVYEALRLLADTSHFEICSTSQQAA